MDSEEGKIFECEVCGEIVEITSETKDLWFCSDRCKTWRSNILLLWYKNKSVEVSEKTIKDLPTYEDFYMSYLEIRLQLLSDGMDLNDLLVNETNGHDKASILMDLMDNDTIKKFDEEHWIHNLIEAYNPICV